VVVVELEECIYRWAYNSIAMERSARELNGLIRRNCKEQRDRVEAYTALGNGFADLYIDMILKDNYEKPCGNITTGIGRRPRRRIEGDIFKGDAGISRRPSGGNSKRQAINMRRSLSHGNKALALCLCGKERGVFLPGRCARFGQCRVEGVVVAQHVAVFGVTLRSLNDRTTRLYECYGFGLREKCATPLMVLPVWSLNDLFERKA
jgi:hypothetical protein